MRLFKCKFFFTIKSTLHFFHWHKFRVWLIVCVDRLLVVIVIMLTIRLHINDDFQHTPVLLPALFLCAAFVSYTHFLSLKESFVYLLKVIAISCNAKITIQIPKDQFIYYCFVLFCIWWTAFLAQHNSFPAQAIQLHLLYYTLDRTSIATIYATIATCNCHIAMTKSRSAYKSRSTLLFLLLWSLLPAY